MKHFLSFLGIGLSSLAVAVAAPSSLDGNTQVPLDAVLAVGVVVVGGAWYMGIKLSKFEMELKLMKECINKLQCVKKNGCTIDTDL